MLDRRSETRLMCADMVGVQWQDESGKKCNCTGLLEDISASGACLQMDDPIALGTSLAIKYRKGHLEGSVCYCFFRNRLLGRCGVRSPGKMVPPRIPPPPHARSQETAD